VHDEQTLLAQARRLDPEALAAIHDTYYPAVYRYIRYRIADDVTAEDLTSEVFTRLFTALRDRNAPQNTLQGWLFGVAARVVSDHHRQHYRRPQVELTESLASFDDTPGRAIEALMSREALHAALAELSEEQQRVLALRFGSELPIRDVAALMGKSEGAVKQLQARAVAALSRRLTGKDA
jgi:RNA polymerase sigma-70 factor, ECF subfamily